MVHLVRGRHQFFRVQLPQWEKSGEDRLLMELGDRIGPTEDPYVPIYGILDRMNAQQAEENA